MSWFIFAFGFGFGVFNVYKFRRHRTYSMGLFYFLALTTIVVRILYFTVLLVYEYAPINYFLTSLPGFISVSVGLSQLMNYTCLIIKLNLIIEERKAQSYSHTAEFASRRKEMLTQVGFTVLIVMMPLIFVVQYVLLVDDYRSDENKDLMDWWQHFSFQVLFLFATLSICLISTTMHLVEKMTELFGERNV